MDAAHEADLARILENRRRRGVSAAYQSSQYEGNIPDSSTLSVSEKADGSTGNSFSSTPAVLTSQVFEKSRSLPNNIPDPTFSLMSTKSKESEKSEYLSSQRHLHSGSTNTSLHPITTSSLFSLVNEQRQLKFHQLAQDKKIDEMARSMDTHFRDLALNMTPSKLPSKGSTQIHLMNPSRQVSGKNTDQPKYVGSRQRGTLPPPLEVPKEVGNTVAPPSSHLDLKSAISVLKAGDWFLKWDGTRTHAAARYVWYDYTRCSLFWGPERFVRSPLGGYIAIEDICSVTTDQVAEFDGDTDRLFFLLVIHTSRRRLYLATEKRSKLDCWYEALTIISLYNKIHQSGISNKALSSD